MAQRGVQMIGAEETMPATTVEKIDDIGREFIERYYDAIQGKAGAWRLDRFYEEKSRYLRYDGQPEREASRANRIVRLITKMRIERQTIAKIEAIFTVEPQPNRFTVVAVGWMSRARRDETHKFVHSTVMMMPPSGAGRNAYSIVWTVFKFADPAVDDYFFGASAKTSTKVAPNVRRLGEPSSDGDRRVVDEPSSSTSFGKPNEKSRRNRRNEYNSSAPGEMVGRVNRKPHADRRPFDVPIGKADDDAAKADVLVVPKQNSMAVPKRTYGPSNSNDMPIDESVVPPQNTKPDVLKTIPIFNDKTYAKIMTKNTIITGVVVAKPEDNTNNTPPLDASSSIAESKRAPDQQKPAVSDQILKEDGRKLSKNTRKKIRKMGGDSLTEKIQTVRAEPLSRPIKRVVRPTNAVEEETSSSRKESREKIVDKKIETTVARNAWTLVNKKPSRSSNGGKLEPKTKCAAALVEKSPRESTPKAKSAAVPRQIKTADAKPIKSLKKLIGYASLRDTAESS